MYYNVLSTWLARVSLASLMVHMNILDLLSQRIFTLFKCGDTSHLYIIIQSVLLAMYVLRVVLGMKSHWLHIV